MILVGVHVGNMSTHLHDPSVPSNKVTDPQVPANMLACSVECQETPNSSFREKLVNFERGRNTISPLHI